jgi:hypothetical protein
VHEVNVVRKEAGKVTWEGRAGGEDGAVGGSPGRGTLAPLQHSPVLEKEAADTVRALRLGGTEWDTCWQGKKKYHREEADATYEATTYVEGLPPDGSPGVHFCEPLHIARGWGAELRPVMRGGATPAAAAHALELYCPTFTHVGCAHAEKSYGDVCVAGHGENGECLGDPETTVCHLAVCRFGTGRGDAEHKRTGCGVQVTRVDKPPLCPACLHHGCVNAER